MRPRSPEQMLHTGAAEAVAGGLMLKVIEMLPNTPVVNYVIAGGAVVDGIRRVVTGVMRMEQPSNPPAGYESTHIE